MSVDGQHSDPVPVEETPVCHEDHQYARNIGNSVLAASERPQASTDKGELLFLIFDL